MSHKVDYIGVVMSHKQFKLSYMLIMHALPFWGLTNLMNTHKVSFTTEQSLSPLLTQTIELLFFSYFNTI